jgi:hypothetical protein
MPFRISFVYCVGKSLNLNCHNKLQGFEMGEKVSNWDKAAVITEILVLIFAVAALYFSVDASNTANRLSKNSVMASQESNNLTKIANDLTQASLQIQSVTSNFNTSIVPYFVEADLGRLEYNESNLIDRDGFINLSLILSVPIQRY